MKILSLSIAPLALASLSALPAEPGPPAAAEPALHCQVPCGIYGDRLRIDLLMEDAATIEKGMQSLVEMEAADAPARNQMVRWIMNKDEHAQRIQDQVAAYWLAQRIKSPADDADDAAGARYLRQLVVMHELTVAAMKCKQTTDTAHVERIRELALAFSETYFGEGDLEHIRSHHAGEHK